MRIVYCVRETERQRDRETERQRDRENSVDHMGFQVGYHWASSWLSFGFRVVIIGFQVGFHLVSAGLPQMISNGFVPATRG